MCGIHVQISSGNRCAIYPDHGRRLQNRGPDFQSDAEVRTDDGKTIISFTSTVLSLRGDHITKQPFVDPRANLVLCWNGEAWTIGGDRVVENENDGEVLFGLLTRASASASGELEPILNVFRSIEGPFAFALYHGPTQTVIFGRDRMGRRSLVMFRDESSDSVAISSVAEICDARWKEVEADGIYVLRLGHAERSNEAGQGFAPTSRHEWLVEAPEDSVLGIGPFCMSLPSHKSVLTLQSPALHHLKGHLLDALSLRILNIPQPPRDSGSVNSDCNARLAVLFSGGLDCSVLARLAHDILDPEECIDLLNVAFENPRVAVQLQKGGSIDDGAIYEACPDRITGRKSFAELQRTCPGRSFRFMAINVEYAETLAHRSQVISLMYPHNTEMDLSIAFALYFAARGQGLCSADSASVGATLMTYTTPARVLLSGLGSDELFGGYGRHAVAFSRKGYAGLVDELKLDVSRLGRRNLGRDDRVMSHWGREVRFPFLDEKLVRWAMQSPVWEKCDFGTTEDVTGVEAAKRVLRLLALDLGMEGAAREKKRAIQFGARTAKMESGRVKGTTIIS